ncbi:chromosome segregation protein SMC [Paenibacillus dendritiformis]|uniref:chromosome segregation protein SMC n=1 Tax=Paenibacillus dendritiformis TaxID=130049 RepID=UPI0018CEB826|nr:chromosome segregation protein SMC [Paenibacillus dendritiformis]MBG9793403.1 chromosome segregation protein SMC [Paenibacillus dendritiformis]
MFLKRLELAGFKSFADRTELEFVQGITGVVGPNGSGKSNISDAIRWVLGEQSAKSLRGGKMEDIIFAGSDARKAVNFGEVSLTLDNSDETLGLDFHEVTVTRRVHRSGDSEYFINKQPCRLKDITELFMDTGIGKEAYSIIGQGRIEEILSTRSEDRRGIFEEASGIVKYKSRKRDAKKKLDDTEQNLLRIHDLVVELEDQIGPLKEQAEKARHFKQLKELLKTKEIAVYVHQIEQLHASWQQANAKLSELKERELALSTVVSEHDSKLEVHRVELRKLEEELERLQATLLHYSEEYEKCEGQGEVLRERKRNLVANEQQMRASLATTSERMRTKQLEVQAVREKLLSLESELVETKGLIHAEEARLVGVTGGTSSDAEESLKGELLDIMNQMAQQRNDIRYYDQQKEALDKRLHKMKQGRTKREQEQADLRKRMEDAKRRMETMAEDLAYIRNRYLQESEQLKKDEALLGETEQAARKWQQQADALVSRRDTMKELANDYDGFMLGVREVLKAARRNSLQGVHGAVAELIRVPEELETAVETALGAALQHIVMENEAVSRAAITFLKQRQLGRATFLPLDVIRSRTMNESDRRAVEGAAGYIGIAADLVRSDKAYANVVGSLLGNVVLAETLEDANRIAARLQYRYRIVTREGDVVNAGGSMTGGSLNKKNANLLGRKRQLEQLDADIKATDKQLAKLNESVAELKKRTAGAVKRLDDLREQAESKRISEQQLASELTQLEKEERQLAELLEMEGQELAHAAEEMATLESGRRTAELRLSELKIEEDRLHVAIERAESARKANESAKEELQTQLTDMKVRQGKLEQETFSLQERLKRVEEEARGYEQEYTQLTQSLIQVQIDLETAEREAMKQTEDLNHFGVKKQETGKQIEFKRADRAASLERLELAESDTKEQRTELKQVEEAMRQTEIQANRLDVELDNLLRKLSDEYEISFELAKHRYAVPDDIEAAQQEVRDLKRQISALGEVNLGAIDEFERINERYQYLSEQKDDLIEAKTALYQVIREMEDEMSKRFKATFDEIRQRFVVVFAKLFGGGRADLVLLEPDNILETGIDIVAQPPGKKLQNLQLLSGGERALTAMALLFAILHVKPVPFCVLDEVEAALDEANVTRFAQYLREFAEVTQFIVVTHRKGTMEEADVLYGVTMEEGGVSKLVSVKLEDEEAIIA